MGEYFRNLDEEEKGEIKSLFEKELKKYREEVQKYEEKYGKISKSKKKNDENLPKKQKKIKII